jgi:hypothetical protein
VFHVGLRRGRFERPTRRPADTDTVGAELRRLLDQVEPTVRPSLRRYIAHWHRMRANCYLGLRERRGVLGEVGKALRSYPWDWKLYAYGVLACIPYPTRRDADRSADSGPPTS